MSDHVGRLDTASGMLSLPLWMAGAVAAVFLVLSLLAFSRAGRDGAIGSLARVALVMIGAGVTWFILEGAGRRDLAAERRALDARAADLLTRAAMPGSALSCLDASAGDTVESACEKALFATPEATAAGVAYVSAQLTLLADMTDHLARTHGVASPALGMLRRAAEADRFGFVARVLAVRDDCTPDACPALSLLNDSSHVTNNLTERTYDFYVLRYASAWPAANKSPVASLQPTGPATPPGGGTTGIYLPSSASIPQVSIMNAEPELPPDKSAAAPVAKQPLRRPAAVAAQPKAPRQQPVDLNATVGPPAYAPQ